MLLPWPITSPWRQVGPPPPVCDIMRLPTVPVLPGPLTPCGLGACWAWHASLSGDLYGFPSPFGPSRRIVARVSPTVPRRAFHPSEPSFPEANPPQPLACIPSSHRLPRLLLRPWPPSCRRPLLGHSSLFRRLSLRLCAHLTLCLPGARSPKAGAKQVPSSPLCPGTQPAPGLRLLGAPAHGAKDPAQLPACSRLLLK